MARREDNVVIGDHQRLLAARRLGLKQVPVVLVDRSAEQAHLLNLALNRISGSWDQELLARLLADLNNIPDVDLKLSGFSDDELQKHLKPLESREKKERVETFDIDQALEEATRTAPVARTGDLKTGARPGLVVSRWNQWVEQHGGEGKATLVVVLVGGLRCHAKGYRYQLCQDAGELAGESRQRRSLPDSLWLNRPGGKAEDRVQKRVRNWKAMARDFLLERYTLLQVIDSINRRYFEGQQVLFPKVAQN